LDNDLASDLIQGEPVFFPRGVADTEGLMGFMADAVGGTLAIDLHTGAVLWRTTAASRPLMVLGQRLVAQGLVDDRPNTLRIVLLDVTRQGQPILISDPVVFPEWVSVATATEESFSFGVHAERGQLLLKWEAHTRYRGGAAPTDRILLQAARDAEGLVLVNLESGTVRTLTPEEEAIHRTRQTAQSPAAPNWAVRDPSAEPWVAGTKRALLVWEEIDGELSLRLATWDLSSGEERRLELARGRGFVARPTPNGRHLFVHREPAVAQPSVWWVFSSETGERVATLVYEPGAQSPCILGDRVYYLVEGQVVGSATGQATRRCTLKARELATTRLLWELPLPGRDIAKAPRLRQ
jgi:hypothetical protein